MTGFNDSLNIDESLEDWIKVLIQAANVSMMGLHIIDADTMEMYYLNEAGFKYIGREPVDYHGKKCYELLRNENEQCGKCYLENTKHGISSYEVYNPQSRKNLLVNTALTTCNGKNIYLECLTDVTRLKASERHHDFLLDNLRNVINNVPGAVCLFKWMGRRLMPLLISDGYHELLDNDIEKEFREERYFEYVHPDDRARLRTEALTALNETNSLDCTCRCFSTRKNDYIWVNIQAKVINEIDELSYIYAAYTDVSRQVQAEQIKHELELTQSVSRQKNELFNQISHDVRTPLNTILNFSRFIRESEDIGEIKDFSEKILNAGKYLETLINDTLEMSRIDAGRLRLKLMPYPYSDFKADIKNILEAKADAKGVALKFIELGKPVLAMLDRVRIQQIYINILNNAIKFTEAGGSVTMVTTWTENGSGLVKIESEVADTGIGISKEFLPHIFEPFVQENQGIDNEDTGSGMGLAIVKKLVDLMDGTISCDSIKGKGTTFTIEINAKISTVQKKAKPEYNTGSKLKPDNMKGLHILLCEDNPTNQQIAVHLLENIGCNVETAGNGKEALMKYAICQQRPFDIVLMDIMMPVMNGLDAARSIRKLEEGTDKMVPIIAMTGNANDEDVQKSREAGMNGHLIKPIEPKLLYDTIQRIIGK